MVKKIISTYLPKLIGLRLTILYKFKPKKAVYKAYLLFSTPRGGIVKPHQKDFLEAHKAEQINFKKIKVQTYKWEGSGDNILLLHGWDSNSYRWINLISKLKALNYNILAFDAPAQGNSEGNLLNAIIYEQVLETVQKDFKPSIIIGHSMGGMTLGFHQYLRKNNHIKKIVLLGAPCQLTKIIKGFQKILGIDDSFLKAIEDYFIKRYGYTFKDFDMRRFATSIHIPTLIIHDKYDKIVHVDEAQLIHDAIKHSKLVITEGAGHSLNKESVFKDIISFIQA